MAVVVSAAGFVARPGLAMWDHWTGGQWMAGNSGRHDHVDFSAGRRLSDGATYKRKTFAI
jgi:hypothetical protein